jgi:tartrate dehydrogenase/decarboxylase/D-malate dehydrogenase
MLEHLGEPASAARLMKAVEKVTKSGVQTPDLGGKAKTTEVTKAVVGEISDITVRLKK